MDSEGSSSGMPGSDNQDSNEPAPPGTVGFGSKQNVSSPFTQSRKLLPSPKGVENAKKRLRAFSIQKKTPITPVPLVKPTSTINTTVLIGKLSSVKVTPKVEVDDANKPPRPPKPGSSRKNIQDSYTDLQKRTLSEIEDMKRKMELVDLGIPLGLICPSSHNDKAMPTKAMPPIKSFLDASKVDEIIREAKKAKAAGREFKFDYQKLLPGYDNPFQRKKDDSAAQEKDKEENEEKEDKYDRHLISKVDRERDKAREKSKRKSDRFDDFRRHSDFRKDERDRYNKKRSDRTREREKFSKPSNKGEKNKTGELEPKETDVNLNDYLVCDSWSLDNDDKNSSPHIEDKSTVASTPARKDNNSKEDEPKEVLKTRDEKESYLKAIDSPKFTKKIEKLQPVIDSFKFEIDPNDEEMLDIFDEDSKLEEYGKSKSKKGFDYNQDTNTSDSFADDNFLESIINEIKQEDMSDDDSQDKGLVEYDSPLTDYSRSQGTPELDDSMRFNSSQRSDYAESYKSTDSGCKSTESGYKSTESGYKSTEGVYNSMDTMDSDYRRTESAYNNTENDYRSAETEYKNEDSYKEVDDYKSREDEVYIRPSVEKELDDALERQMGKETVESLDIWNFVLKICQPLLFRHDRSKCYKQTRTDPAIWWAERVSNCGCVRGRGVVAGELRARRAPLVDRVYGCDQIADEPAARERSWYPARSAWLCARAPRDRRALDQEYQRFMQAVLTSAAGAQSQSTTPERDDCGGKRRKTKPGEGWSQDSEAEEEPVRSKKPKTEERQREKRKRKRSSSTLSSATDDGAKKKTKKKTKKKLKAKMLKRARTEKKQLKKLKGKQKKKKSKVEKTSEDEEEIEEPKKKQKEKKIKKKQSKTKKTQKKRKAKAKSSSSSSTSSSSSDSDERQKKSKKKKKRQDDAFDLNILNNIKTEKLTDDEKCQMTDQDFSPRRQQERRQEIINVKELQNDFVGVQIKQEVEEMEAQEVKMDEFDLGGREETRESQEPDSPETPVEKLEFKEPHDINRLTPQLRPPADETNLSQCSSQESMCSETEVSNQQEQPYEKDDSHLRPSSQNSNYSFNDVIASQSGLYSKGIEASVECEKFESYEQENYEMYEQLAMAYQSDVASNQVALPPAAGAQRIETVVLRGEIKCDWRAGDEPAPRAPRRSRWGLKPNEVNIVLTAGPSDHEEVYRIESIANNRNDDSTGYDEAYMDTYGAMDRLQYGDCFARPSLDERIQRARGHAALGDVATEPENPDFEADKENLDKGILITKVGAARAAKRVSFADGYKPGQDSDTEEPPLKKKKRIRRVGCAWPCPATHPDHVPLWDALPPPPPPPGDPPAPPEPIPLVGFMPPKPPPGIISFT